MEGDIQEELRRNPYSYICNYYESIYPYIGKRVFQILSLVPISLVSPRIESELKTTNQKISLLWLSPPGSCKTVISSEFEKIAYNPLSTHKMTPARLAYEIKKRKDKKITLIVSDVSIMFSDEILTKILESVLEEGQISWDTMRTIKEENSKEREGVAYLAGTPSNISNQRIRDGIIGRTFPLIIYLGEKNHRNLLRILNERMGKKLKEEATKHIKEFYQELYSIQEGNHKEINPIQGHIFPDTIKKEAGKFIEDLPYLNAIFKQWGITGARTLEEFYRVLSNHSFLNIFNREIRDNKIVVNEQDLKVAKHLIKVEEYYSYIIYKSIESIDYFRIKTERDLRSWLELRKKSNIKTPPSMGYVMRGFINK